MTTAVNQTSHIVKAMCSLRGEVEPDSMGCDDSTKSLCDDSSKSQGMQRLLRGEVEPDSMGCDDSSKSLCDDSSKSQGSATIAVKVKECKDCDDSSKGNCDDSSKSQCDDSSKRCPMMWVCLR